MLNYTKHALMRIKNRGFSRAEVDTIFDFGEEQFHNGKEILSITKRSLKKMRKYWSGNPNIANQLFERLRGTYIILKDGLVITIGHQTKHHKLNRKY